jgi:hypothetical protein
MLQAENMTMRPNLTVKDPTVKVAVQFGTSSMLLSQNKHSRLPLPGTNKGQRCEP